MTERFPASDTPKLRQRWAVFACVLTACIGVVGLTRPAVAQVDEEPSYALKHFLEEIRTGDIDAALGRIARIESLSGRKEDLLAISREDLASLLRSCSLSDYSTNANVKFRVEKTTWSCPENKTLYVSFLNEEGVKNPYLNIVGIQDSAMKAAAEAAAPRMAIPPPALTVTRSMDSSPEARAEAERRARALAARQTEIRDAFGQAVVARDMDRLMGLVQDDTRIIYQTRDPYFKTDLVEMDERGSEHLRAVLARAERDLGLASSVACEKDRASYAPHICRWTMPDDGKRMFAFLHFDGEQLKTVQFYYVTREMALEMRRRAIEAGIIDG